MYIVVGCKRSKKLDWDEWETSLGQFLFLSKKLFLSKVTLLSGGGKEKPFLCNFFASQMSYF